MNWRQLPLGAIQTNCYILHNEENEALIIDPGDEADKIKEIIEGMSLKPLAILLTHAHFDHIGAMDEIRTVYSIPVYLHQLEADWPSNPEKNGSAYFPVVKNMVRDQADHLLQGETSLTIGSFSFKILETPGHSPGSVSYYFPDENIIFSGDTLFYGSIGRTDLYMGDQDILMQSIEKKLLTLPEDTIVAPGHGFETTIQQEKVSNPFL